MFLGLGKMVVSKNINEWNQEEEKLFLKYGTILVGLQWMNFKKFY